MALDPQEQKFVESVISVCQQLGTQADRIGELTAQYFDNGWDSGGSRPISDVDTWEFGGDDFTPTQFGSVITMLDELEDLFFNAVVTTGDYGSTLNRTRSLASPNAPSGRARQNGYIKTIVAMCTSLVPLFNSAAALEIEWFDQGFSGILDADLDGSGGTPDYDMTAAELAATITLFQQLTNFRTNAAVTQADYIDTLNKVRRAV